MGKRLILVFRNFSAVVPVALRNRREKPIDLKENMCTGCVETTGALFVVEIPLTAYKNIFVRNTSRHAARTIRVPRAARNAKNKNRERKKEEKFAASALSRVGGGGDERAGGGACRRAHAHGSPASTSRPATVSRGRSRRRARRENDDTPKRLCRRRIPSLIF